MLVWILISLGIVASLLAWGLGFRAMRRIRISGIQAESYDNAQTPKLSVIVLARADIDLTTFLESIRKQDYPNFEVIMVHEGTMRENQVLEERYINPNDNDHPKVKCCFYPPGSHSLSRKKLAITLGAKAAEGEWLLITSARCVISSNGWLSAMAAHFNEHTDVVLGRSKFDYDELASRGMAQKRFNHLMSEAQWIDAALANNAFRGDGLNLAYRRSVFFAMRGFADMVELENGDDDIFISSISTPENTAVEFSDDAVVMPQYGDAANRIFDNNRRSRVFTSKWLRRAPFRIAGAASLCQWIGLISLVVAGAISLPNVVVSIAALIIAILIWLLEAYSYRRGAEKLGDARGWKLASWRLLCRPLSNWTFNMHHRKHHSANYTFDILEP